MFLELQSFIASHPFAELGAILVLVIALSYVMKVLKQPLMIGYILAGLLVSPNLLGILQHSDSVTMFSHLGVALLLFMVGIGLNPREIKETGSTALIVGAVQIVLTVLIGAGLSMGLGYDLMTSVFVGIALSFSSTIIIVKLLGDRGVLEELFSKVTVGVLILQDMVAMILLIVLSSLPADGQSVNRGVFAGILVAKLLVVAVVTYLITTYILPKMLAWIAQSQEFLLVFAIGRCLIWAATMEAIGFSLEIGALIAGLTIASLPYRFEILSKIKPLRDFFIVLFFVGLGAELDLASVSSAWGVIVVFSLFVLVIKPLLVVFPMKYLRYKAKTSILTGTSLGQVSEFSFILMALLVTMGQISDPALVSVMTMVGLVTIAGSSYYMNDSDTIIRLLKGCLAYFEVPSASSLSSEQSLPSSEIIVFGNHRTGEGIVDMLLANKKNFVIIDYDPRVIKQLEQDGLPCRYGDAGDVHFLEELNLDKAKMIVSTIHNYEANALILHQSKKLNTDLVTILSANKLSDAEALYDQGATYVLLSHIVGGRHMAMLIEQYEYDIEKYAQQKVREYGILAG